MAQFYAKYSLCIHLNTPAPVNGIAERHQRFPVSKGPLMEVNGHIRFRPNRLTANLAILGQMVKFNPLP
jgi:hypothetical protein